MHPAMTASATPASEAPSILPLSALDTDISMAVSMVPSMGFTMKGMAARPAAVGTALAHSASTCAAARPSAVAFTTQRMKEPGQNTEASICQVKVSSATMAPRLVFWDSSVEAMTERDEGERRQRSNTEGSYEGAGRGDASVEEAVRIAREGVCQGGVPRGLTALGRKRKKKEEDAPASPSEAFLPLSKVSAST